MQRREALRSALFRNLQAEAWIHLKLQSEIMSIPRPSDPHWVTGNMEQASPFLETGNFVGQGAGGFKPEEWSTGWGSDGMSTGTTTLWVCGAERLDWPLLQPPQDILMAVGYRYTYEPGYTRGGLKDFFTMSLASETQDQPNICKMSSPLRNTNPSLSWLMDLVVFYSILEYTGCKTQDRGCTISPPGWKPYRK